MDPITKHAQVQGEMFEALAFFNQAVSLLSQKKTEEYLKGVKKLFQKDIIGHLAFEESGVFPLVVNAGTLEEKRLIRSLQRDHINLLEKIDQFEDLLGKAESQALVALSREIIELMLAHSRKEDRELFPLLKSIGCRVGKAKITCK